MRVVKITHSTINAKKLFELIRFLLSGSFAKGFKMHLFHPDNRNKSEEHKRTYAIYELAYTINDVSAAALFVIGSILFFYESTTFVGTWLFLIGSIMFGLRPMIKLLREIKLIRMGKFDNQGE